MSSNAEMYACLYAREFPAQALLRLRPEAKQQACAVMQGEPPLERVCATNTRARKLGVTHGMTRVEIDTIPGVTVLARSAAEEASARSAVLECVGQFSPRVEEIKRDHELLCVLDISGTEKLFGAPADLAKKLLASVRRMGVAACMSISVNFHAAICLAQGMSAVHQLLVVPADEQTRVLAPLPLSVLGLSEAIAETFTHWGVDTLGMLAGLPEPSLISRLGQHGKQLRAMARGEHPHLFQPIEPEFALTERMELDSPVEMLESLLFITSVMLQQLIVRAQARALALASVTLMLSLEGGATHTRTVQPALPSNDRQLWTKLLHLDLEAHPPDAAVLALALSAEPGLTGKVQLGLFSPQTPESARLDVTLARIRAIVGEEHAGRAVLLDTHRTEGFHLEPFRVPPGQPSPVASQPSRTAMRQLRPAENIAVHLRDGRLDIFFFRGTRYAVERAYGPWLTSGEWWSGTRWRLRQWDVIARADESVLCGCITRSDGRWLMAGLYD